jgi:NAD(P)-dependent dehydrogenase (short-subunit alcohol dehydrogenase family)
MRKVAIITGGSSGIGKALVEVYAKDGYAVVFTGRDETRTSQVAEEMIAAYHEDIVYELMDVKDQESNELLVERALETFGRLDVVICNAGVSMRALIEDLRMDVFKEVMDTNFYGALYLVKAALPHVIQRKGTFVAISSINGLRSTPARSAYSVSKFAMEGFFETLRMEMVQHDVHVLTVNPGFTKSNIRIKALDENGQPQGNSPKDEEKMMMPEEVATLTLLAMKRKKRNLVLTSTGRWLVRLNYFFPAYIDKILLKIFSKEQNSPLKSA